MYLLRILFENFCQFHNHLLGLFLSDALIWVLNIFVQNPGVIRSAIVYAEKFQHRLTILIIIQDLQQICVCLNNFALRVQLFDFVIKSLHNKSSKLLVRHDSGVFSLLLIRLCQHI